jgi:hypothetical protein
MGRHVFGCVLGVGLVLAGGRAALAETRTFPGAAPCDTTLQACVDGATEGDVVQLATNGPIAEGVSIAKSLTLEAAPGFTPQFAAAHNVDVQMTDPARTVVVRALTMLGGTIHASSSGNATHHVTITDCHVTNTDTTGSRGLEVSATSPMTAVVERNTLVSNGYPVSFSSYSGTGDVTVSIAGNQIRKAEVGQSATGIELDLRGGFVVTADVRSNLVSDVADCNCGGAVGFDLYTSDTVSATVNLVNNTIDLVGDAGINVATPGVGQLLAVNIFNNVVTRTARGLQLPAANPRLTVSHGNNDFFSNGAANVYGGYPAGPGTVSVDPLFVSLISKDYHLTSGSPLVNAGTNSPPGGLSDLDVDGNVRIADGTVDIGAFEYGSTPPTTTTTTAVGATTTTTTLAACAPAATSASVLCRLDALTQAVANATTDPLKTQLTGLIAKAAAGVQAADGAAKTKLRKKSLGRALKALGSFGKKLKSKKAKSLDQGVRDQLAASADGIKADVKTLRAQ